MKDGIQIATKPLFPFTFTPGTIFSTFQRQETNKKAARRKRKEADETQKKGIGRSKFVSGLAVSSTAPKVDLVHPPRLVDDVSSLKLCASVLLVDRGVAWRGSRREKRGPHWPLDMKIGEATGPWPPSPFFMPAPWRWNEMELID